MYMKTTRKVHDTFQNGYGFEIRYTNPKRVGYGFHLKYTKRDSTPHESTGHDTIAWSTLRNILETMYFNFKNVFDLCSAHPPVYEF